MLARIVYTLVGVSGLIALLGLFRSTAAEQSPALP
jgi:uncharacterized membrane protein YuzA (DUF378 family)